jgi:hypothetical protein
MSRRAAVLGREEKFAQRLSLSYDTLIKVLLYLGFSRRRSGLSAVGQAPGVTLALLGRAERSGH